MGSLGTKLSALETLGYVCEELTFVSVNCLQQEEVNVVLGKVVEHMKIDIDPSLQYAACTAMLNMLEFAEKNFDIPNDRNLIMQACCQEANNGSTAEIRSRAYESLVKIVSIYYSKMKEYMQTLFDITMMTIKKDDPKVGMQALEFWCSVSELEHDMIQEELEQAEIHGSKVDVGNMNYVKSAVGHLVPTLLECMTKVDDDDDDDDENSWNIAKAGTVCLNRVALAVREVAISHVMPFIEKNIANPDWKFRNAAILAFGNILDGADPDSFSESAAPQILEIVMKVLQHLLNLIKSDTHVGVKDSAGWAIGIIVNNFMHKIPPNYWKGIIDLLMERFTDAPRVASKAVFCVYSIAANFNDKLMSDGEPSNIFSPMFEYILQNLLVAVDRPEWDEHKLRVHSLEAINAYIRIAASDKGPILSELLTNMLMRLNASLSTNLSTPDLKDEHHNLQNLLCMTLNALASRLNVLEVKMSKDQVNNMMNVLVRVIDSNPMGVEEAFLTIGVLAGVVDDFGSYMDRLYRLLIAGLRNSASYSLCNICIGLTGDIAAGIGIHILPYCDEIMTVLLTTLGDKSANRFLKSTVIAAFNEIAMAIEENFEKYIPSIMPILAQASEVRVQNPEDDEFIQYVNELHEAILEAYAGILHGLDKSKKVKNLLPHMNNIFYFLKLISDEATADENVIRLACLLVGDVSSLLGAELAASHLKPAQPFVTLLVERCKKMDPTNERMITAAQYAFSMYSKAVY
jgi:importin subunit beta-1